MELMEAMRARHSVRSYTDRPIGGETLDALETQIEECNCESGLRAVQPGRSRHRQVSL